MSARAPQQKKRPPVTAAFLISGLRERRQITTTLVPTLTFS